jgi:hypothetical protein
MTPEWDKIEADFREWAFYEYYDGPFKEVHHPLVRFARALVASIAPIKDRQAVMEWHRLQKRGRTRKKLSRIASNSRRRQRQQREASNPTERIPQ